MIQIEHMFASCHSTWCNHLEHSDQSEIGLETAVFPWPRLWSKEGSYTLLVYVHCATCSVVDTAWWFRSKLVEMCGSLLDDTKVARIMNGFHSRIRGDEKKCFENSKIKIKSVPRNSPTWFYTKNVVWTTQICNSQY